MAKLERFIACMEYRPIDRAPLWDKHNPTISMPQFLLFSVETRADRWGGFFGPPRNLLGVEDLCVAFHDDPAFVEGTRLEETCRQ